ncbi:MAG: hypothetical protein A2506_00120 [Elusimicrobia bacterium RIFOXYD12_FULL_66_9]|nr:MAG: hypothetical protein A2506_00120 [Elusimicrobia bacterium RIFOXYD12_FULL_66_9]
MRTWSLAFLLAAVLTALGARPVRALDSAAGTSGAAFMKVGQGSARAMALGRAYVALAEGSDALTWNPAGLAATQQREIAFSYLRYIQGVKTDISLFPGYIGYAHPMGRTTWGANFAYMRDEGFDVRDANGVPQQDSNVGVRNGFGTLGMARSFWYEKLFLGASLRTVHEDIAGSTSDTMVGDLGVILKPTNMLSLGFSLQNIGASSRDIARVTRGGAALRLNDFMTASVELNKASDSGARLGLGGEFQLPEEYLDFGQITLRLGYQNADNYGQSFSSQLKTLNLDRTGGLSFGIGIYTSQAFGYGLALDYAFVPMGALGTVDQISFKMKF